MFYNIGPRMQMLDSDNHANIFNYFYGETVL